MSCFFLGTNILTEQTHQHGKSTITIKYISTAREDSTGLIWGRIRCRPSLPMKSMLLQLQDINSAFKQETAVLQERMSELQRAVSRIPSPGMVLMICGCKYNFKIYDKLNDFDFRYREFSISIDKISSLSSPFHLRQWVTMTVPVAKTNVRPSP